MSPGGLKSRCQSGCIPSGGPKGELVSLLFSPSRAAHIPWLVTPSSIASLRFLIPLSHPGETLSLPLPLPGPPWLHQAQPHNPGQPSLLKVLNLNTSASSLSPHWKFQGLGCGHLQGAPILSAKGGFCSKEHWRTLTAMVRFWEVRFCPELQNIETYILLYSNSTSIFKYI